MKQSHDERKKRMTGNTTPIDKSRPNGLYLYDEFDYAAAIDNERSRKYYNTGFKKIDNLARPRSGHVTMIPGFTDHGKSSVLRNIAYNMFCEYKEMHSLYYAFEEQAVDTYTALSRLMYFDKHEKNIPRMHPDSYWEHITKNTPIGAEARGYQAILSRRIHVVDKRIRPSLIGEHIKSVIDKFNVEVVFIDYLQDMKPERDIRNAPVELEEALEALEDVTKEYNICTNIAAQYLPDVKNPEDKYDIVGLTKIFGSSSAYKKAKLFLSVFNETAFNRVFKNGEKNPAVQKLEFDILKQKGQQYGGCICYDMCSMSNRIYETADHFNAQ